MSQIACKHCVVKEEGTGAVRHFYRGDEEVSFETVIEAAAVVDIDPFLFAEQGPKAATNKKQRVFTRAFRVEEKMEPVEQEYPLCFTGTEEEAVQAGWTDTSVGWLCKACTAAQEIIDPPGTEHGAALDDGGPTSSILGAVLTQEIGVHVFGLGTFIAGSPDPNAALGTVIRAVIAYQRYLETGYEMAAVSEKALGAKLSTKETSRV